jgi:hypothetical protein
MENYPHLPPAEVRTTQAAEYMALLNADSESACSENRSSEVQP